MPRRPRVLAIHRPAGRRDRAKRERDAFYASSRSGWRDLRAAFLADNPLCEDCFERDVITPSTIAHHFLERLDRPDLALDSRNLRALCPSCHTIHHKAPDRRGMNPK